MHHLLFIFIDLECSLKAAAMPQLLFIKFVSVSVSYLWILYWTSSIYRIF
jgi:hypothetical protein